MAFNYIVMILAIAAFVMSVVLHEVAHGYVARLCGDPTAEIAGRLTLNPIKHIDPIMTIAVPLGLLIFSGGRIIFGGAKPVPVNPYLLRNGEIDDLKVSLAGVSVNFSIALLAGMALKFFSTDQIGFTLFTMIAVTNLMLGFFNLIPVPPLDGSHVARFLISRVSHEAAAAYERMRMFGLVIVILFMSFFGGYLVKAVDLVWFRVFMMQAHWGTVIQDFWSTL